MSDTAINVRIWNYHWQVTFSNVWSWSRNEHWFGIRLYTRPFAIYDFKPWRINRND